jgi:tetracycline 7-halogenase / FADH2 O2-dependent halogenase
MSAAAPRLACDVAVVGSGFAGSLMAMALRRRGRSVTLLERGTHPRFAIGESSTPLANLLIEQLADEYDLPGVRALSKWGTWQRTHPHLACGLKRGFSFFRHDENTPFRDDDGHAGQLLVAASPHDDIADTHWYRPDVDAYLVAEAQRLGAVHLDRTTVAAVDEQQAGVELQAVREGEPFTVRARFLVDASGPRGCLHRLLGHDDPPPRWLPATQALYAHFEGVGRWDDDAAAGPHVSGAPFPVDDAALHHVFPGGWVWVLRFNNGITSAGAALTEPLARDLRVAEGAAAWSRLLERFPSLAAQFAGARAVTPFTCAPRLAFRSWHVTGRSWAMLPSAAGVIDPLLSTGFPLTLLGVQRLLHLLVQSPDGTVAPAALGEYGAVTTRELDATERLVAALYASMRDFASFKRLALLYFAAASFSETVRRLGRDELAKGFLLCDDDRFGPALAACVDTALARPEGSARDALFASIDEAIAPFDLAGLHDRSRRDWYPVLADDLVAGAAKVAATPAEIDRLLERCGFGAREGDEPRRLPVPVSL